MNKVLIFLLSLMIISCGNTVDPIEANISKLVLLLGNDKSNGFVIFEGRQNYEYVQYALDVDGLLFNWPFVEGLPGHTTKDIAKVELVLQHYNFIKIKEEVGKTLTLNKFEYEVSDDGIYANVGRDKSFIKLLTMKLFDDLYGFKDMSKLKVTLEIENN